MLDGEPSTVESVDDLVEKIVAALDGREEVQEAYLFGSCARGARRAHSDVDVAVFVDRERTPSSGFGYQSALTAELMSRLKTNRVDVVVLNDAPPLLYHRVLRDGVRVLSRDLRATTVREGRALSRFCDFAPHLAKVDAALGFEQITEAGSP